MRHSKNRSPEYIRGSGANSDKSRAGSDELRRSSRAGNAENHVKQPCFCIQFPSLSKLFCPAYFGPLEPAPFRPSFQYGAADQAAVSRIMHHISTLNRSNVLTWRFTEEAAGSLAKPACARPRSQHREKTTRPWNTPPPRASPNLRARGRAHTGVVHAPGLAVTLNPPKPRGSLRDRGDAQNLFHRGHAQGRSPEPILEHGMHPLLAAQPQILGRARPAQDGIMKPFIQDH
jgi:hypothetical protein